MSKLPVLQAYSNSRLQGEYSYIEDVVRIGYPIRTARTYLRRHMGNKIQLRLVEVDRGEEPGKIRCAEVQFSDGSPTVEIISMRVLPDGSPASFYTPIEFVEIQTIVQTKDGSSLPSLNSKGTIVLFVPVRSYLRFLPGLYSASTPVSRSDSVQYDDQTKRRLGVKDHAIISNVSLDGSHQFQEFMLLFQHMMTKVLDKIDDLDKLIDPLNVDPIFLPWLASWLNFQLDSSLPIHQQRELVRRAILLQRIRGTCFGVSEMIRILTSAPVRIKERCKPKASVLGQMTIGGGRDISRRFLNKEPAPSFVLSPHRKDTAFFVIELESMSAFRNRFGDRCPDILRQITQIVSREMPAQVVFTIEFQNPTESKNVEGQTE